MPIPSIHINISASVVSAYAAVLATVTGAVQVVNHLRDRAHLRIRVQPNSEMIGDPRYQNRKLLLMSVANAGRRPITITCVGAYRLYPHNPFVMADTRPALPCELTEGKEINVIVNQKDLDLSVIESWEAYTTTGKTYRLTVVPWYRRWWNRRKLRRQSTKWQISTEKE